MYIPIGYANLIQTQCVVNKSFTKHFHALRQSPSLCVGTSHSSCWVVLTCITDCFNVQWLCCAKEEPELIPLLHCALVPLSELLSIHHPPPFLVPSDHYSIPFFCNPDGLMWVWNNFKARKFSHPVVATIKPFSLKAGVRHNDLKISECAVPGGLKCW